MPPSVSPAAWPPPCVPLCEVHGDPGVGAGVGRGVVAAAAHERVPARAAVQHVVAVAAVEDIVAGVAGERVAVVRTRQVLDAVERIAGGVAAAAGSASRLTVDAAIGTA